MIHHQPRLNQTYRTLIKNHQESTLTVHLVEICSGCPMVYPMLQFFLNRCEMPGGLKACLGGHTGHTMALALDPVLEDPWPQGAWVLINSWWKCYGFIKCWPPNSMLVEKMLVKKMLFMWQVKSINMSKILADHDWKWFSSIIIRQRSILTAS